MSKLQDFISLLIQAARAAALGVHVEPYRHGSGAMITALEHGRNGDLDRFLIEITSLADQDHMGLQLSLRTNNVHTKSEFQKFGFYVINDDQSLQMERNPQGIIQQELEFMESAPPGKKAERFIRHRKAEFKDRYGKKWKERLYATAWKLFGESRNLRDYLSLVESLNSK